MQHLEPQLPRTDLAHLESPIPRGFSKVNTPKPKMLVLCSVAILLASMHMQVAWPWVVEGCRGLEMVGALVFGRKL